MDCVVGFLCGKMAALRVNCRQLRPTDTVTASVHGPVCSLCVSDRGRSKALTIHGAKPSLLLLREGKLLKWVSFVQLDGLLSSWAMLGCGLAHWKDQQFPHWIFIVFQTIT